MKQRVERRLGAMVFVLAAAAMLDGGASKVARSRATIATASTERDARAAKGRPLKFEMNAGQWDPRVRFVAHDRGATLFVTDDAMMVGLHDAKDRSAFVSMKLVGVRAGSIAGEERLGGRSNFFFGSDASKWRRNVPTFGQVRAKDWLPGVDVVWHRGDGGLEYDLALAGGVDASTIELEVTGANAMHVRDDGALALDTDAGTLLEMPPHVVQDGRTLAARYRVVGERSVAFAIDDYDRNRPVLIDPTLVYSTYLGGSSDDYVNEGIAVDSSGNVYVIGLTYSSNFPTTSGAIQTTFGGSTDVLVTKLNATASAIVYSTYMGGAGSDNGYSMIVDSNGNATIVGYANIGFPTTTSAYQTAWAGGTTDAFVAKLDATGALQYSTYFGGNSNEDGYGLAIDASGNVYISGETGGGTFPTTSGAYKTTPGGSGDGFIAKLDSTLSTLSFSTFLGGSKFDNAPGLAVDTSGNVYVSGSSSGSFPTTTGAYQTAYGGNTDAIVAKLDATGSTLLYSTYLGGTSTDACGRIAIDSSGNAYVIGATSSTNFPVTSGAFQTTGHGGDAFVTKLNASGSALVYSTYLGGASNVSRGWDIAIDGSGNALVVGGTSGAFPTTTNAIQTTYGGGANDAFITKVGPAGDALVFSTYLGGSKDDQAYAIAIDSNGDDYVAGYTGGSFTTTTGVYQTTYAGGTTDIFIAKLHNSSLSINPPSATIAPKGSQSFTAKGGSGGYTWSLKTNASGGNINASTGAYTAGPTGSVVDVVEVTDSSSDAATASVTVGAGVSVAPPNPTTPPKNALTFSASGGSGTGYTYALTTNGSGGSINASSGAYTAGATANVADVVTATDSLGNSGTTTVTVGPGVSIAPSAPATPPKGDIAFFATGGSDAGFAWSISNNNSGAAMDGSAGAYTAGATGSVVDTVGVVDSLGNTAAVNVSVGSGLAINPATPSTPPKGAVAFSVTGGSGSGFTWLLATNASGGAIDADSGAYTAGSTPNVKDTVGVTDSLGNKANVDVTIAAGVSITPTTATLATGASTTFSAAGGSGKGYAWSLATNASSGNITSGGVYTAGPTGNVTDTVQLADSLGNTATASVTVTKAVVQDASPVDAGAGAGDNGGCGCKTAGPSTTDATAPAWMAAAMVAMALRHRRSRRRKCKGDGARAR